MTTRRQTLRPAFMSTRMVAGLVVVSALSLIAFLALYAYAPELRSERSSGANALSASAVGFAGLRLLLNHTGTDARLGRLPPTAGADSLVVLTPDDFTAPSELKALVKPGPKLIVLPKWITVGHPLHPGWVESTGAIDGKDVAKILSIVVKDARIKQADGASPVHLASRDRRFAKIVPGRMLKVDALQTISGPNLDTDIVGSDGGDKAVLVHIHGTQTYILSDPDFLSNLGIRNLATARLAAGLIQKLRVGSKPVSFDVTLNGFRETPSILHEAFAPPFLGATLCAILASLYIAVHALSRFGQATPAKRAQPFGKRALADNTAAVIRLMHRETRMAPRYAEAMRNQVAAHAGVTRARAREAEWLAAFELRGGATARFSNLQAEAYTVRDIGGMMRLAKKLYQWRRGHTG